MTTITLDTYLHCAEVRRVSSGKTYLIEDNAAGLWASPLEGDKIGAPVTFVFLRDNFELVKPSPYTRPA